MGDRHIKTKKHKYCKNSDKINWSCCGRIPSRGPEKDYGMVFNFILCYIICLWQCSKKKFKRPGVREKSSRLFLLFGGNKKESNGDIILTLKNKSQVNS